MGVKVWYNNLSWKIICSKRIWGKKSAILINSQPRYFQVLLIHHNFCHYQESLSLSRILVLPPRGSIFLLFSIPQFLGGIWFISLDISLACLFDSLIYRFIFHLNCYILILEIFYFVIFQMYYMWSFLIISCSLLTYSVFSFMFFFNILVQLFHTLCLIISISLRILFYCLLFPFVPIHAALFPCVIILL